ncbi:MAG: hypothetical protein ACREB9_05575 [Thermoplasmata archaeon]
MTDPEPCPYRTCAIPKPEHEVREFGPYTVFYPPGGGFPHGIVETVPPPAPVAPTSHREAMRAIRERRDTLQHHEP